MCQLNFTGILDKNIIDKVESLMCSIQRNEKNLNFPDKIIVKINEKMRSNGGWAKKRFNRTTGDIKYTIELNYNIFKNNDVTNTFIHELAHIIVMFNYFNYTPHGYKWRNTMRQWGYNPTRCHKFDVTGLKRRHKRYPIKCGCMVHNITKRKLNNIKKGIRYRCNKCLTLLEI